MVLSTASHPACFLPNSITSARLSCVASRVSTPRGFGSALSRSAASSYRAMPAMYCLSFSAGI